MEQWTFIPSRINRSEINHDFNCAFKPTHNIAIEKKIAENAEHTQEVEGRAFRHISTCVNPKLYFFLSFFWFLTNV